VRAIFVDCPKHSNCTSCLGFYEPGNEEKEQIRALNVTQWPEYAPWLKQHPRDALAWTTHNPDTMTPEQVVAKTVLGNDDWTPDRVVALDYTSGSKPGREVAWPDWQGWDSLTPNRG